MIAPSTGALGGYTLIHDFYIWGYKEWILCTNL